MGYHHLPDARQAARMEERKGTSEGEKKEGRKGQTGLCRFHLRSSCGTVQRTSWDSKVKP